MFKNIFSKSLTVIMCCLLFSPISGALFAIEDETGKEATKEEATTSYKEEKVHTLIDSQNLRFSGYGAPILRFADINNAVAVFTGGRGGLIINNSFVIGGGGYAMVLPRVNDSAGNLSTIGYGGLLLEYYFFPKNVVNFSIGTIIGAGGGNNQMHISSAFFAIEPEINAFVNVTSFFRLGLGVSYRYTSGLEADTITDANFRGVSVGLLFEFGKF